MLVFTSRGPESLSRVLIEASALGVPIAAMNTGGTPDIVVARGNRPAVRRTGGARRRRAPAAARRGAAANGSARPRTRRADALFDGAATTARIEQLYRDLLGPAPAVTPPIRVAVIARSVFPLHGHGGLERHVYDLVRASRRRRARRHADHAPAATAGRPAAAAASIPGSTLLTVPYRTFPLAGRRGTTVIDRSTAYPLFGERAGRLALDLVRRGAIDIVHGLGASVLGYARQRPTAAAPLVLNPQGLEEFGATDPGRARLKRIAYLPLRRRCAPAPARRTGSSPPIARSSRP